MKVADLKAEAKRLGMKGYSKLIKQQLIDLLKSGAPQQIASGTSEPTPTPPPRSGKRFKPAHPVKVIPSPQEVELFEKEEMKKIRPLIIRELSDLWKRLENQVPLKYAREFLKKKIEVLKLFRQSKTTTRDVAFKLAEKAFGKAHQSHRIKGYGTDIDEFFENSKNKLMELIESKLKELGSAKIQTTTWIEFVKEEDDGEIIRVEKAFNSTMMEAFQGSDMNELVDEMFAKMKTDIENPKLAESKFKINEIKFLDANFHKLNLTRGSSYLPLSESILRKKAVINPINPDDEECFKWAVIASQHHEEIKNNVQRISKLKKFEDRYDWEGLEYPVAINKIDKFERRNPEIAVYVLSNDNGIYVCRRPKEVDEKKIVHLLLISDGEKRHYTAVKNLSRLLGQENSKHKEGQHFCINCVQGFHSEKSRDEHFEYCRDNESVRIVMPEEGSKLSFHDGQNQFKVPFTIYADFESVLRPMESDEKDRSGDNDRSYTDKVNEHVPSGFCTYSKFAYGWVENPLTTYRGEDCVQRFCEHIQEEAKRLYKMFPQKSMKKLTKEQWGDFNTAKECHICMKPFEDSDDKKVKKVRDHCHYTGEYRGAAHSNCNLRYKIPSYIPVVFHNLSGYDAHLFVKELGKQCGNDTIGVIAENKEKYISFNVSVKVGEYTVKDENTDKEKVKDKNIQLRFIDSFRFMNSGLDKLTSNLAGTGGITCECGSSCEFVGVNSVYMAVSRCKSCGKNNRMQLDERKLHENFSSLYQVCSYYDDEQGDYDLDDEKFRLLLRKGVYPYEYMNGFERFDETKLPPIESFYSNLYMSGISEIDYEHAQRVWKKFGIRNMGEYHDLYLKTDVLLLSSIFESFRDTCLEHYQLDPAHFYTIPGLAWKAGLKKTGIKLELLTDIDMLLMFEKGIRGGLTQAVHRYAKANNKYMGDMFNPNDITSYLQYLDANNLYGWAMIQKLPTGGFKWITDVDRFTPEEISKLVGGDKGYLLEVDVNYPQHLHEYHNDLSFMPERMKINKVEKLIANLYNKKNYMINIETLNQALKHGLVLEKVHRVIEFDQSAWLKPYIDFNTDLRTKAKNDFEKDFFKLMNNSVFGKTMENIRNHKDIKLVTNEKSYCKMVMKPNFKNGIRFSKSLMGCEMGKTKIVMNKPVYLGQTILDLSKTVMYEFHYDYIKPKYGDNAKLCYMDTDSLVYHIKTDDFYKDISDDVETRFDTSAYNKKDGRPLPIGKNKKVIGLMKDELSGKIMTEFVALRAKTYAYKEMSGHEDMKCKGIKKCVVKNTLGFDDYYKCLIDGKDVYRKQMMIGSSKHDVHTKNLNKVALNRYDDKRIIQEDGISTLARGHYELEN